MAPGCCYTQEVKLWTPNQIESLLCYFDGRFNWTKADDFSACLSTRGAGKCTVCEELAKHACGVSEGKEEKKIL